jgi:fructose-specific component phosphotransferase system IIB-like protein
MAEKRRVFVSITGNEGLDLLNRVIAAVGKMVNEIVDKPDDADLIVVSPATAALRMLKENDEAKVLVVIFLGGFNDSEGTAARALRKAYPDRVVVGYVVCPGPDPEDVMLVSYLLGAHDKQAEEVINEDHAG